MDSSKRMSATLFRVILLLFLIVSACKEDDTSQGVDSLQGVWQVNEAISIYDNSGNNRVDEAGNLGQFIFGSDTLRFEYTRNDTLYQGVERWQLQRSRENQGFSRVNVFTLIIENHDTFICEFGDQTRNSEKNATNITLRREPEENSQDTWIELSLSKQ
ncbi:MAG: hypothetical protein AAF632_19760 [Bacteroidota bacterium]